MKFLIYHALDEYKENADWIIEFNGWAKAPYSTEYRAELKKWCQKTFGPPGMWDLMNHLPPRWKDEIIWGQISFRDQQDAEWFMLKWS